MTGCVGERHGGYAFFDHYGAAAIFGEVDLGVRAPLSAKELARDWRPTEDCGIGEMEHVVEAVPIVGV